MERNFTAKSTSVWAFAKSVFVGMWNYLVYGFGAVILAYWAYAINHTPPAWAFLLVIGIAFFVASYLAWASERSERNTFGAMLTPQLVIDFDYNGLGFLEVTRFSDTPGDQALFIHVLPRPIALSIDDCRGFLTGISVWSGDHWERVFAHRVPLYWSGHEEGPIPLTLYRDSSQFLDVAFVLENGNCINLVHPRATYLLNTMPSQFGIMDIIKLDILVAGENASASISLKIKWGSVWSRPEVTRL